MAMKFCPKCGNKIEGNMKFCTKCGAQLTETVPVIPANNTNYTNAGPQFTAAGTPNEKPPVVGRVNKRSIVTSIIFTIVTCGFYGLYWIVNVTDEINILLDRKDATSGLMTVIFTIVTCGLYGLYWAYKLGENVDILKGSRGGNTGILYLIVFIFGFGIINIALAQDAINDKIDGLY